MFLYYSRTNDLRYPHKRTDNLLSLSHSYCCHRIPLVVCLLLSDANRAREIHSHVIGFRCRCFATARMCLHSHAGLVRKPVPQNNTSIRIPREDFHSLTSYQKSGTPRLSPPPFTSHVWPAENPTPKCLLDGSQPVRQQQQQQQRTEWAHRQQCEPTSCSKEKNNISICVCVCIHAYV